MSVRVRPASLQDGVAVLALLEDVGYYPEPIGFAQTYRKTLTDPLLPACASPRPTARSSAWPRLSMR